ncbi:SCP2 sterol-binding domain-containing protein [Micromonospora coxensis]|uniref:SCP-2 sterol transfer family protein n=1 Tax=Micromonospora coxensis TaxID=356852 RepID=A0A1C5H1X8_9ACTN|nr:SCP2 sterol-binding domain-containing protein [Micromonospora coxensis]SCG39933.1 SCP-2 sterol transfer family protein [Micromonospora coxensis]
MPVTDAFFQQLAEMGHDPRLCKVRGSIRFDIREGDRLRQWLLMIDHGQLRVSPGGGPAQAVLKLSSEVAEAMVRGELNGLSAMLRGEILVDGDLALALRLGRLFPAPAVAREAGHPWPRR